MGDPNASIPTPQPVHYRPMFAGLLGKSRAHSALTFVSAASLAKGLEKKLGVDKSLVAVLNTRGTDFKNPPWCIMARCRRSR